MNAGVSNDFAAVPEGLDNPPRADTTGQTLFVGAGLLIAFVFFTEAELQNASMKQVSLHWHTVLQLLLCGACGIYGLARLRSLPGPLGRFPGAWTALFGLWALATVPTAVDPRYAAGASIALWGVILFAPANYVPPEDRGRFDVLVREALTPTTKP